MLKIEKTTEAEIQSCHFDIDEHTVRLTDKGTWYALKKDGVIVSVLCIRVQRNELYIGEVFTDKQHRGKGYFTMLCKYVVDEIFPGISVSTHALKASKNGFERCGFKQYAFRHFKHGDQWWLRRDGKKVSDNNGQTKKGN